MYTVKFNPNHQPTSTFWDRCARLYDWTQWGNRRTNAAAAARAAAAAFVRRLPHWVQS